MDELLEAAVRDAQAEGAIDPAEDPEQLVFELDAYLLLPTRSSWSRGSRRLSTERAGRSSAASPPQAKS